MFPGGLDNDRPEIYSLMINRLKKFSKKFSDMCQKMRDERKYMMN